MSRRKSNTLQFAMNGESSSGNGFSSSKCADLFSAMSWPSILPISLIPSSFDLLSILTTCCSFSEEITPSEIKFRMLSKAFPCIAILVAFSSLADKKSLIKGRSSSSMEISLVLSRHSIAAILWSSFVVKPSYVPAAISLSKSKISSFPIGIK